ncbi:HeH/LEM domain-containing protein [Viridibacillus arvi]|uniref:HeH/LEM domain-containing protein n=1 Tax=Viridibacillus arvi TaxID=263475 RepID=UPI0038120522
MLVEKDGKQIEVTDKAYRVYYQTIGFKPCEEQEPLDLFGLSAEELEEYKVPQLKAFLKQEGIEFDSNAKKEELIALITGEEQNAGE